MTVKIEIPVYEVNGEDAASSCVLLVKSDVINSHVRLEFQGKCVTVSASDLSKAVNKARNDC